MAFSEMAFNPSNGLLNTSAYPTQPADETAARTQIQTPSNQLRDYINNTFLPALASSTTGESGADNIGSGEIEGVTGTTIQAKIEALKTLIDALSISASGLIEGVVETSFLANLAVTAAKLAADAVETIKIKDSAVTTDKIADDAVTQDKIAAGAVSATELADNAVSQNKIATGAVTNTKLNITQVSFGTFRSSLATSFSTIPYIKLTTTHSSGGESNYYLYVKSGVLTLNATEPVPGTY
jgi:hypothetical protein